MQNIRITQDAELMLCILYGEYKVRRKEGMSRSDARNFGSSQNIQDKYIKQWPIQDIDDAAVELRDNGLFQFLWADNTVYADAKLTNEGITYMENLFGEKFDALTKRIATLRAIIFG